MDFSHYTAAPVELAIELVNTEQSGGDALADIDGLRAFLEPWRSEWEGAADPPRSEDLAPVRRLRQRLRLVFEAEGPDDAAGVINEILDESRALPRVSTHSGVPHLHFEPLRSGMSRWLAVVTAMGLATVMVEHGVDRFGVCSAEDCADVYVDTSRNRSRRHCSTSCSTRHNVAAYRRRRREGD